jgi:hypothetical protein
MRANPASSDTGSAKRTRSMAKPARAATPQEYWLTPGMNRYPPSGASTVLIMGTPLELNEPTGRI